MKLVNSSYLSKLVHSRGRAGSKATCSRFHLPLWKKSQLRTPAMSVKFLAEGYNWKKCSAMASNLGCPAHSPVFYPLGHPSSLLTNICDYRKRIVFRRYCKAKIHLVVRCFLVFFYGFGVHTLKSQVFFLGFMGMGYAFRTFCFLFFSLVHKIFNHQPTPFSFNHSFKY